LSISLLQVLIFENGDVFSITQCDAFIKYISLQENPYLRADYSDPNNPRLLYIDCDGAGSNLYKAIGQFKLSLAPSTQVQLPVTSELAGADIGTNPANICLA